MLAGAGAQVGGDGGNAVGLFDAELCDGQVRTVQANERNVGAVARVVMKGRWRPARRASAGRGAHLPNAGWRSGRGG